MLFLQYFIIAKIFNRFQCNVHVLASEADGNVVLRGSISSNNRRGPGDFAHCWQLRTTRHRILNHLRNVEVSVYILS